MTLISGEILRAILWWVPLYLSILFMVIVYIAIMCKLYFDKKKYTPMLELNRNEVYKKTFDDGECFVSLLVEPIAGKNVSPSDKKL